MRVLRYLLRKDLAAERAAGYAAGKADERRRILPPEEAVGRIELVQGRWERDGVAVSVRP